MARNVIHDTIVLSDSSDDYKDAATSRRHFRSNVKTISKVLNYSSSEASGSNDSFEIDEDLAFRHKGEIVESSSEIENEEPIACDASSARLKNIPLLSPEKEQSINNWLRESKWNSDDETDPIYKGSKLADEATTTPIIQTKKDIATSDNILPSSVEALMDDLYGPIWRSAKKTTVPSSSESDDSFDRLMQKYMPKKENRGDDLDRKFKAPAIPGPSLPTATTPATTDLKKTKPRSVPTSRIPATKPSTKTDLKETKPRAVATSKPGAKLPLQPVVENSGLKLRSFLESLSPLTPIPWCDPKALDFQRNFKTKKEELTKVLYKLFNETVFDNKLPPDMLIEWNVRLNKTAGYCFNRSRKHGQSSVLERSARIEISTKVCNSADRLRDTLVHEMCHAANWILSGVSSGHGPSWKAWAATAMRRHAELPVIGRCHSYRIDTKYTYKCTVCGYSINRHSKSLNTDAKRCGYCHGTFELLVNSTRTPKNGGTPVARTPKAPSGFALYVKANYSDVKKKQTNLKHADVMKVLSQQFSATKI